MSGSVKAAEPILDIYEFSGVYKMNNNGEKLKESLKLENTLWANTVLASSQILGLVTYTGKETRMALNSRQARSKFGRLDSELNFLAKLLFLIMVLLSIMLVLLGTTNYNWDMLIVFNRYLILLSSVIPISLRVNLDFAKLIYCFRINIDKDIEGTVSRSSQIPEELGRIEYLLSDKTGTLTQNEMIFKRISLESQSYTHENVAEISSKIK
jgi:phospholipid-translocating ATPase